MRRKANERLADLIDPDRVLREAANIAYSDLRDLFDEHDRLLPPSKWPDWAAPAISSIEVTDGTISGGTASVTKIKAWDKLTAIGLLFKNLGLLNRDREPPKVDVVVHDHIHRLSTDTLRRIRSEMLESGRSVVEVEIDENPNECLVLPVRGEPSNGDGSNGSGRK